VNEKDIFTAHQRKKKAKEKIVCMNNLKNDVDSQTEK
jgi:hypothetical protein